MIYFEQSPLKLLTSLANENSATMKPSVISMPFLERRNAQDSCCNSAHVLGKIKALGL
jgi:hypothetical protein